MNRIIAVIIFIFLIPLFLLVSLIVLLFSGYPIFYKQKRMGKETIAFNLYKFRTMKLNSGSVITRNNDNRITAIGRFLRKTKLDELPQLLNIIKGDINFVGPRPEVTIIVTENPKYFGYLELVKPGITDISSIVFKNEAKLLERNSNISYERDLLPIKTKLVEHLISINSTFVRTILVVLTPLSLQFYYTTLTIISSKLLPMDDDLRKKLNQILSVEVF
ncbi:MAG: sugar transferase [Candidatus Marinimicrobia bacterium]|nr:sugar transferase [Candidatus Neomarinimicrobiota bacterium]MBL7109960.1 sugar transferase [Candidatus Neomarinimicrobiota bacterium]